MLSTTMSIIFLFMYFALYSYFIDITDTLLRNDVKFKVSRTKKPDKEIVWKLPDNKLFNCSVSEIKKCNPSDPKSCKDCSKKVSCLILKKDVHFVDNGQTFVLKASKNESDGYCLLDGIEPQFDCTEKYGGERKLVIVKNKDGNDSYQHHCFCKEPNVFINKGSTQTDCSLFVGCLKNSLPIEKLPPNFDKNTFLCPCTKGFRPRLLKDGGPDCVPAIWRDMVLENYISGTRYENDTIGEEMISSDLLLRYTEAERKKIRLPNPCYAYGHNPPFLKPVSFIHPSSKKTIFHCPFLNNVTYESIRYNSDYLKDNNGKFPNGYNYLPNIPPYIKFSEDKYYMEFNKEYYYNKEKYFSYSVSENSTKFFWQAPHGLVLKDSVDKDRKSMKWPEEKYKPN